MTAIGVLPASSFMCLTALVTVFSDACILRAQSLARKARAPPVVGMELRDGADLFACTGSPAIVRQLLSLEYIIL